MGEVIIIKTKKCPYLRNHFGEETKNFKYKKKGGENHLPENTITY
jgi:hypothetical protein